MNLVEKVSLKLHTLLATDQNYFAVQCDDGNYRTTSGQLSPTIIKKNIESGGALLAYQKHIDSSVKWICYDFDILKKNLDTDKFETAKKELIKSVLFFTRSLRELNLPYLVEHSGNRGFHIWIILSEKISYITGYEILQAILNAINLSYDKDLIGIDLFPKTKSPTHGVGLGVKIPISKHKKSGFYSWLLNNDEQIKSFDYIDSISDTFLQEQIDIIDNCSYTCKVDIENKLGIIFDVLPEDERPSARIKFIKIQNKGFTLDELFVHWGNYAPFEYLKKRISDEHSLNNEERKLIVGLLGNVRAKGVPDFNFRILHLIFSNTGNYNRKRTELAIKGLSSFNFPSQNQIENITGVKFGEELNISELLGASVPKFLLYEDATFDISYFDINITRIAELNYVFQNDEAQSRLILNELSGGNVDDLLSRVQSLLDNPTFPNFYKHHRNEGEKTRELISLCVPERLLTSCIMKQLIYLFDMPPSVYSHGYKPNKGFRGGYIFEPWLYLWIKFLSNIGSAIGDTCNKNFYIVKTDIKKFYVTVPHDNLKRLLLGGVNERIDTGLANLDSDAKKKYDKFIDVLFNITQGVTGDNKGLPQGPAYARYFAELYLDNIDRKFEDKLNSGDLILYQRYVDDIFFIAPSEMYAKKVLDELEQDVKLLGLSINQEKTVVSRVGDFSGEFNSYRSQSKYAVDTISRDFEGSTKAQKDLAVNEFLKLIHSESCNDDLSFIFSHLSGVKILDTKKLKIVLPTLKNAEGRGSLYKNLYGFVFENTENWKLLNQIENFSELQSEVLLSSAINFLEGAEVDIFAFSHFIEGLIDKLTISQFVNEHLAYLFLRYGINVELELLEPKILISCIVSFSNAEELKVTSALISHINTELNNIKVLSNFVEAIYPLCASTEISKGDLNDLAQTYYSKLSVDYDNNVLSRSAPNEIKSPLVAEKFYYLLCLFSLSCKNESVELLKETWKFCTCLFNEYDIDPVGSCTANWMTKIENIDIHDGKAMVVMTSIVDGNIFRGPEDKKNIFEKFHSIILVFLTINKLLVDEELIYALKGLKDKAEFYRWLTEPSKVKYFPASKLWFEKNVIMNGAVFLRKEQKLLIRKPSNEFYNLACAQNEDHGYSEVILEYRADEFKSIRDVVRGLTLKERLDVLLETISDVADRESFPNVFCNEKILIGTSLKPFNEEIESSRYLIFEGQDGVIESYPNDLNGFMACFFKNHAGCEQGEYVRRINEKYIRNLCVDINLFHFIKNLAAQLSEICGLEDDFYYDAAMSSALYLSLFDLEPIQRIERFVEQYHRFNKEVSDRHIYCVNGSLLLDDCNPRKILESVEASLGLLASEVIPSLSFYLSDDIKKYREELQNILLLDGGELGLVTLDMFLRAYPRISNIDDSISVDGTEFKFENSFFLNPVTKNLQNFESKHAVMVDSAEHIYYAVCNNSLYLISLQQSISKIFLSIKERFSSLENVSQNCKSYPNSQLCHTEVESLFGFDDAVNNISVHRDVEIDKAKENLIKWLIALPRKFHQAMVTLISAHEVMNADEVKNFLSVVKMCQENNSNSAFLIKQLDDYGGAQRLIYKHDDYMGRSLGRLEPINILEGEKQATIIIDNIISGTQVINALTYYVGGVENDSNYFEYGKNEKELLARRLKAINILNICTVLYVRSGVERIQAKCRHLLNDSVVVTVISGRDVGVNGTFETTEKIGALDKLQIKKLLTDKECMQSLYACLDYKLPLKNIRGFNDVAIGKTDLVARYQSLPKKCFEFLHLGTKLNRTINPLVIIPENYEYKKV